MEERCVLRSAYRDKLFLHYLAGLKLKSQLLRIFSIPSSWLAIAWLYSFTPLGSYWASIADTQPLIVLQSASLFGISGINALIIAFNSFLSESISEKRLRKKGIFFVLALILILAYGGARLQHRDSQVIPVAIVQTNFPMEWEWRKEHFNEIIKTLYEELPFEVQGAKLVVFPQYTLPGEISKIKEINELAKKINAHIILGTYRKLQNIAPVYNPEGKIIGEYSALYIPPFRKQDYKPSPFVFEVEGALAGPLLCYDDVSEKPSLKQVKNGAQFLINMMNDKTFESTVQPKLHLSRSVIRAIELGRPLLRASQHGSSAVIDSRGRIVAKLNEGEKGVLKAKIEPRSERTVFSYTGDLVSPLGFLIAALLLLMFKKV